MNLIKSFGFNKSFITNITKHVRNKTQRTFSYDPFYLNLKAPIPFYSELQFSFKCFDFSVLEHYTRYVHSIFTKWQITASVFPSPTKSTKYTIFHPDSTKVRNTFDLNIYQRVFCIEDLKSTDLPILIDLLLQNLPEGIDMKIDVVDPVLEEERYVPNLELETLHSELSKLSKG